MHSFLLSSSHSPCLSLLLVKGGAGGVEMERDKTSSVVQDRRANSFRNLRMRKDREEREREERSKTDPNMIAENLRLTVPSNGLIGGSLKPSERELEQPKWRNLFDQTRETREEVVTSHNFRKVRRGDERTRRGKHVQHKSDMLPGLHSAGSAIVGRRPGGEGGGRERKEGEEGGRGGR
ncbi:hypothetical protein GUITHDRAFT_142516 [Guillardia theta CCMP2712]|uniref:Uncharacterized protein n=1 Tax=Guillardia theta (strain CCMP2712) TaxID=905079 RepID=L1IWI9_GUITC|nr:hypothetical protein GUITHDRAFT_142516 [Guillardia theta CCMP2712]EKX40633.1 hypothetical protein GUITHDRAFT_142516 [Guillardia theta CCMP2712]|eukprot:XP_005827613.1 hypothetical protein GUITHDRAFT_142516 [Guillardia theta CCMP2712]